MKDLYLVYRDWHNGDFDIMGLDTLEQAIQFCEFNPDYQLYETTQYDLAAAKSIFKGVI